MKEKNVIDFYVSCNKLKDVIRTGWKRWRVKRKRVESVAEHVYGVQMLAVAMWSEYDYKIDLRKVLAMLAIHELEEIKIGDFTPFEINSQDKNRIGSEAVERVLSNLTKGEDIKNLVFEFNERKTKEAQFAYFCDKLEACLQSKLYDEERCVKIRKHADNAAQKDLRVQELLKEEKEWSKAWIRFWQERAKYDENFMKVSEYAKENNISNMKIEIYNTNKIV